MQVKLSYDGNGLDLRRKDKQLTLVHAAQGRTLSTLSRWAELIRQSEADDRLGAAAGTHWSGHEIDCTVER